jgi:hypothetical protein
MQEQLMVNKDKRSFNKMLFLLIVDINKDLNLWKDQICQINLDKLVVVIQL